MPDAELVVKRRTTNLFGDEMQISGPLFPPSGTPDSAHITINTDVQKNFDHQSVTTGLREEGMRGDTDNVFEVIFFCCQNKVTLLICL